MWEEMTGNSLSVADCPIILKTLYVPIFRGFYESALAQVQYKEGEMVHNGELSETLLGET